MQKLRLRGLPPSRQACPILGVVYMRKLRLRGLLPSRQACPMLGLLNKLFVWFIVIDWLIVEKWGSVLPVCHRLPQLLLSECYSQIEETNLERSASVPSKRLRSSRRSLSEDLLNLVTSSIQNLVVTFRWCCVRVKASEIAFVGFDHLPMAGSNSLPLCVGMSPTTP